MKILQICLKPPLPLADGGCIAMNAISEGLLALGHQLKILSICTQKHPFIKESISEEYLQKTGFQCVQVDTNIRAKHAFLNLFSESSYNIDRFYSESFDKILESELKNNSYDVVHLESLFVSPYLNTIRKYSKAKAIYRAHNIEHIIWEMLSARERNPLIKAYLKFLASRMKKYEFEIMNRFDGIAAISANDKHIFEQNGCTIPIQVFPLGINFNEGDFFKKQSNFEGLFHLGSMDWLPNLEGIEWFVENVWEKLHLKYPEIHLHLAGRKMPDHLMNLNKENIHVEGEIKNAKEYFNSKSVMIVPLHSGSGLRVKIIEGMAAGKTIISTVAGADGIDYTDGENILIANSPDEFVNLAGKCFSDIHFCNQIAENAFHHAREFYDNSKIAARLLEFYNQV